MLRRWLIFQTLCAGLASAGVWKPAPAIRAIHPLPASSDAGLWDEYGFDAAERADFGRFQVSAFRFKDATGAFGAWQWIQASQPGAKLSGSLVLVCTGNCPKSDKFPAAVLNYLDADAVHRTGLPVLPDYLPAKDRIEGSSRYILGPAGLAKFAPGVPAQPLAFQFSTEAALAHYRSPEGGEWVLLIASYPTPGIARQQASELHRLPGLTVKRSGPLVAIVPAPNGSPYPSALLGGIHYLASVTWDEKPPDPHFGFKLKSLILGIAQLTGFLFILCIAGGIAFGGIRLLASRFGHSDADAQMIVLRLSGK